MESSAIARQSSKVFQGSSSSCAEPEVIEIVPPLADWRSKMKAKGKQKEVAYHEIIDLDIDEDHSDVVLLEGNFDSNKKRKRGMGISMGPSSAEKIDSTKVASSKKGKEISGHPPKGFNPGSNNLFDLDDYVFDDDYWSLLSHFDSIGVPAKTVDSNFSKIDRDNHLSTNSNSQAGIGSSSFPQLAMNTSNSKLHESIMKNHMESNEGSVNAGMSSGTGGIYSLNDKDVSVNGLKKSKSKSNVKRSSGTSKLMDADVQKRYENFKRFDTVVDYSDHKYANQNIAMNQPPKNWAKRIQEEWRILEKDLPDTISVRAYESRMDLLRAVIIGAEGTPYHDGLFFFDVCFPNTYPNNPPYVNYHSGGLHINPNLYNSGYVCLSLLNTWAGVQKERWVPGTSTMLQVLVSIQGLILNMKPYFNEPGFEFSRGSAHGEQASIRYNENTLILSLKTMVYTMTKPPKNFEDLVIGHFQHRMHDILMACKAYTEGVQVGCLVKGGVQDVDEVGNSCSLKFKNDVGSYIKTLIEAFTKIGAKEAKDFLSLSVKKSLLPPIVNSTSAYNGHW